MLAPPSLKPPVDAEPVLEEPKLKPVDILRCFIERLRGYFLLQLLAKLFEIVDDLSEITSECT